MKLELSLYASKLKNVAGFGMFVPSSSHPIEGENEDGRLTSLCLKINQLTVRREFRVFSTLCPVSISLYCLFFCLGRGTSDPFAVVAKSTGGETAEILGQTEVIENCLSPNWVRVFVFDFQLGVPCLLQVTIFDQIKGGQDKREMGKAVFDVGETLGAKGSTKAKKLKMGGTLFVTIRKSTGSGNFRFKIRGAEVRWKASIATNRVCVCARYLI